MKPSQIGFSYDDLPSCNLIKLFNRIYDKGQITARSGAVIQNALLNPTTSQEDRVLLDRLCWAVEKGRLTIADDANFPFLDQLKSPKPSIGKDGEPYLGKLQPVEEVGTARVSAI